MDRVALAVCVLASAGCRQLFGIDDTAVAADAGDDPVADGAAPGDAAPDGGLPRACLDPHLACADFDSPSTGIAQFAESIVPGGTWAEEDSALARSPPRVLVASLPPNNTAATTGGLIQFPDQQHVIARVWVQPPLVSTQCAPLVLTLLVSLDAGVTMGFSPSGYRVGTFGLGSGQAHSFGTAALGVHELELEVDVTAGSATARANGAEVTFLEPALALGGQRLKYVALGLGMVEPHGACLVAFDDLVADAVMP